MAAPTSYKEYCKVAYAKNPRAFGKYFDANGKPIRFVWWSKSKKKTVLENLETLKDIPKTELVELPKDGFKRKPKQPSISITGTQLKYCGYTIDLTIWPLPVGAPRKEYNRAWMHNQRVRARIKLLKDKHGITYTL